MNPQKLEKETRSHKSRNKNTIEQQIRRKKMREKRGKRRGDGRVRKEKKKH